MNGEWNVQLVYLIVFAVVFVPYLFLSFFLHMPKEDPLSVADRNLPPVFRRLWRVLSMLVESLGCRLSDWQPRRTEKLRKAILVGGMRMTPEYVFTAEALLGISFLVAASLLVLCVTRDVGKVAGFGLLAGLLGYVWPALAVYGAAERRQTKIVHALPFSIDLIGSAMRSGVDFTAAVRYYVMTEDKAEPLTVEYAMMLRELELGKTRIDALEAMSARIQHDAFSAFADAVIHGLEVGASIVDTLKIQSEEMRRVRFNIAERKAARAASSMIFPIVVFIMPAMFLIIGTPILIRVFSSGLGGLMK